MLREQGHRMPGGSRDADKQEAAELLKFLDGILYVRPIALERQADVYEVTRSKHDIKPPINIK